MKKPNLSSTLNEELKKHSKKEHTRRIITYSVVFTALIVFVVLAKIFVFKGNIRISETEEKSPSEKIETVPATTVETEKKPETKPTETTTPASPAPAPAPAPTPAPEQGYTTYVVKEGDTLSQIANANGMTSKELMDYNSLVDPELMPGQNLKIPKK